MSEELIKNTDILTNDDPSQNFASLSIEDCLVIRSSLSLFIAVSDKQLKERTDISVKDRANVIQFNKTAKKLYDMFGAH